MTFVNLMTSLDVVILYWDCSTFGLATAARDGVLVTWNTSMSLIVKVGCDLFNYLEAWPKVQANRNTQF